MLLNQQMANMTPEQKQQMLLNQQMLLMGMGGMGGLNMGMNQPQSGETKLDAQFNIYLIINKYIKGKHIN